MVQPNEATPITDYDNPWKSIIERYFREFIAFFFPWIEPQIDWAKGWRFLDKELQQVVRDAEMSKRYADKLAEVWKTNGESILVLCHIEVQNQQETDFPKRIFVYNYRLRDRYNCSVASLVILGDESENWRPHLFEDELWGCSIRFDFPIVKLLDYQSRWAELEASQNPFAVVVMAHLKTKETHNNALARKEWKFRLTTMLYERGYEEQDILDLYHFLDWLMGLPEDLDQAFQSELEQFEEARKMKYVTAIERRAEARGVTQGVLQGKRSLILRLLSRQFGELPAEVQTQVEELPADRLDTLVEALLDFGAIADLTTWLTTHESVSLSS